MVRASASDADAQTAAAAAQALFGSPAPRQLADLLLVDQLLPLALSALEGRLSPSRRTRRARSGCASCSRQVSTARLPTPPRTLVSRGPSVRRGLRAAGGGSSAATCRCALGRGPDAGWVERTCCRRRSRCARTRSCVRCSVPAAPLPRRRPGPPPRPVRRSPRLSSSVRRAPRGARGGLRLRHRAARRRTRGARRSSSPPSAAPSPPAPPPRRPEPTEEPAAVQVVDRVAPRARVSCGCASAGALGRIARSDTARRRDHLRAAARGPRHAPSAELHRCALALPAYAASFGPGRQQQRR